MKKKTFKFMILILIVVFSTTIFTGCGFAFGENAGDLCKADYENKTLTCAGKDFNGLTLKVVNPQDFGDISKDKMHGITFLRDGAINLYNSVFGSAVAWNVDNDPFSNLTSNTYVSMYPGDLATKALKLTADGLAGTESLATMQTTLRSACSMLLFGLWLFSFLSTIINERFTFEGMLKSFCQLLCGFGLVYISGDLVNAFVDLGVAIGQEMGKIGGSVGFPKYAAHMKKNLESVFIFSVGINFFNGLLIWPIGVIYIDLIPLPMYVLCIPMLIIGFGAFKVMSAIIIRTLELAIRTTFAPIPLAFGAYNGFTPESLRFFRSLLACALQPGLIIVGCAALEAIAGVVCMCIGGKGPTEISDIGAYYAICITYIIFNSYVGETKHLAQDIIARS